MARTEELARVFKALSDANRVAIFQRIRRCCGNGCRVPADGQRNSVTEIAERFDLSLSTVSHHLKALREAGLIVCEKRGRWVYCGPNEKLLRSIREFAGGTP